LAKEENDMNFFAREKTRQQTEWGNTWDGKTWFAYIDAPITDPIIIEQAKTIVDHCAPQRYGPYGTHAYSFLKREYLLNLLLFHYADYGFFPAGHICITDEWPYEKPIKTTGGSWFSFKCRKAGRKYQSGWWIKIPSLADISSQNQ
jgi:hypothetical protein